MANHVCPLCDKIVQNGFGHEPGCSKPETTGEIPGKRMAEKIAPRLRKRYARSQLYKTAPTKEGTPMARTRAVAAVEEPEETDELDLTVYAEKPITVVAEAYTEWLEDQTGYAVDERTVYLAMSLRRKFQHDEDHDEIVGAFREKRAAAKPKAAPKTTSKTAPAEEAEEDEEPPKPAPPKARGRAAAAPKPAPPAGRRGAAPRPAPAASSRRARGTKAAATTAPF